MGLAVQSVPSSMGYDLLINGTTRVTLRVAFQGLRRHCVTVAGRRYQYRYRTWHFNFHHHGRLQERYTDYFVCLGVSASGRATPEVFVIPWESVTGKTFSLHGGRTPYSGRYARFRDAWHLIGDNDKGHGDKVLRRVA
jgi:hypothetical protein